MAQFNVGDTVVLKSGSPTMTVVELNVSDEDKVACRWYEGKKFLIDFFPPNALRVIEDSDGEVFIT